MGRVKDVLKKSGSVNDELSYITVYKQHKGALQKLVKDVMKKTGEPKGVVVATLSKVFTEAKPGDF